MISFNQTFYFSQIRVTFYPAGNEIVRNHLAKFFFKYFFYIIEYVKYYISKIQKLKNSFLYILIVIHEIWNIWMEDIGSSPY